MSTDLLGVSVSGLRVAQSALGTTGHNIANAGVDGYSRQRVLPQTNLATLQGGAYVGNGVNIASIERQVNAFAIEQLRDDTNLAADVSVYHDNISQLDSLLSDVSTGLSSSLNSFFASMQNGVDDPTSIPARQLIISESENLADRFNTIYGRLADIESGITTGLQSAVSQVNALSSNIAQLNGKISDALGASGGAQPNDLLDQRDEALRQLAELVSIQSYDQGFGQINVVIGSGQNLVVGTESRTMDLQPSGSDAGKYDVVFEGVSNTEIVTSSISGGEIGGLLRFRDQTMDTTYNQLGRIAVAMADSFNEAHNAGIDLNGNFGGNFFYDVNDDTLATDRVTEYSDNSISSSRVVKLNIVDSSQMTTDDYHVIIENGGLFRVTREPSDAEVVTGLLPGSLPFSVAFDGVELEFSSGSFAAGDEFRVQPTRAGARDFASALINPQDIAFGVPVLTDASLGNVGSGTISAGTVLSLQDQEGNPLPLLATSGAMDPPLVVKFTSDTTYDVLDNSDPGNPLQLDPPIRNQHYVIGGENALFSTDPGETFVTTSGDMIGIPVGRSPEVGGGVLTNGYPAEVITFTRPSEIAGASDIVEQVITSLNASAATTASMLNNIAGVTANASTYMEISNTNALTLNEPLQVTLNGEDLIEYEFDSATMTYVIASNVPDPAADSVAFNNYLSDRINANSNLAAAGIYSQSVMDSTVGQPQIRVFSSRGDDLQIALEADNTGPDTLNIGDGNNPSVALTGNGAGITSAMAVGGSIDLHLAEGITLGTFPPDSMLFGDTQAADFATSTYLGIQASLGGIPQTGDTFTLDFNENGASDNRNGLLMANLENAKSLAGGTSSYADGYGALVETIGIATSSAKINADAAEQVLEQSTELRNSVSGVNLDEEASNLIKFEQMYSANTQVISVARDLFDRLIGTF